METTFTLKVSTAKGRNLVGFLGAMAILFALMAGITIYMGAQAPREIVGWGPLFLVPCVAFAAVALAIHARRGRTLRVVRDDGRLRLQVAEENIDLPGPLSCRGRQVTVRIKGIPVYHVYLQVIGSDGNAILLLETRGAIHGALEDWPQDSLGEAHTVLELDVGGAGQLRALRGHIARQS